MMDYVDALAQLLAGAACIIIFVRAESAINGMNRRTPIIVRLAFWLLLIGAVGAGAQITLADAVPPWPSVFGSPVSLGTASCGPTGSATTSTKPLVSHIGKPCCSVTPTSSCGPTAMAGRL